VLSTALTLRVTAFVLLAPLAGALADRFDRKRIMLVTRLARMVIVSLLPFITQIWQIKMKSDRASIVQHHKFLRFPFYAVFMVSYKRLKK